MPAKLILNADVKQGKISKHIYGHFAEHLGRCVYGAFGWVKIQIYPHPWNPVAM